MKMIRPVSDLQNNFAEISKTVHETAQPVFLTKNGYGDMVVLSMEAYENLQFESEVYCKLQQAGIVKKTAHPTNSIRQPAPDFAPTVRACAAEEGFPHWLYCVGGGYSRSR
ncbi:type II toxin-antitoxin system Phd/YefM family antitoxin, partial [Agathobaculum sp. LCP25S3_E8]|uniref:type II toxin-antitoxin system Phd/YefM family antitoxin n=1 Tax=Agathobaculum sp. LCP25S3_E8 TaxID=3438735 RepID=UPI003F8F66C7